MFKNVVLWYFMDCHYLSVIASNSDVPANHVEMRRQVREYECPLLYSHGALRARPMCCSEPDDVPFLFGIPPTVSQEIFILQLIARGLPFNQKLHRLSKTVH